MRSAAASPLMFSVSAETFEITAAFAAPGSATTAAATAIGRRIRRIAASCCEPTHRHYGGIPLAPPGVRAGRPGPAPPARAGGQDLEDAHHPQVGVRDEVAVEHGPPGKSANRVRNVMLPPSGAMETVSR